MRRAFKRYGKNLEIRVKDKSISYPNISFKRPRKFIVRPNDNFSFESFGL